jgi:hypothetical protein
MKVLTIKQPFATLICLGIKDVENRTWPTKLRRRILIHAGAANYNFKHEMTSEFQRHYIAQLEKPYIHSAIIGSVEIIDCIKSTESPLKYKYGWGIPYCYHWILANPILFENPIPAKGKLSFWNYELNENEL